MKTVNTNFNWSKPLGISLATGAIALAPLLTAAAVAQAAPPDRAPSDVYRDRGRDRDRDWDRDRDRDRDKDRDRDRDRDRNSVTLSGVVTRDLRGSQFLFRADNGRNYTVDVDRGREPRQLSVGDRVEVRGRLDDALIQNSSVRILSNNNNNNNNNGNRVTLTGAVTNNLRGNQFELRADDGRTYRVEAGNRKPNNLSRNDRITVSGVLNGNTIQADSVRLLSNNGNPSNGASVTLTGIVTRDLRGSQFLFRADNGRNYTVDIDRGREPRRLSVGDRVEVRGRLNNTRIQNSSVRILSNNNNNNGPIYGDGSYGGNRTVNFPGTVVTVHSRNTLQVRGDNNSTYEVTTKDRLDNVIRNGDRVRVVGQASGFYVTGAYVTRGSSIDTYRRDDNNNVAGNVDFTGTIESTSLKSFRVRGDNGQTYEVKFNGSFVLRRDQRVRVRGNFDGTTVEATNVDKL